jgi:hypothetical protein
MYLEYNYDALTAKFPAFARCPRFRFLQCLTEVCTAASSERANDHRAATLSPSLDSDADRDVSWTPESTPPPTCAPASSSPAPTSCAAAIETQRPVPAAAWEGAPKPAGSRFAETSLGIGIKRASSADATLTWHSDAAAPIKRCRSAAPAAAGDAGDAGCLAWFAAAWVAGGAWAGLNAGEAVDAGLYQHWASIPTLRVDAGDLERFGRSTSF